MEPNTSEASRWLGNWYQPKEDGIIFKGCGSFRHGQGGKQQAKNKINSFQPLPANVLVRVVLLSQLPVGLHRRVTLEKLEKLETWTISAGFKCENTWKNKWTYTSKTVLPLNIARNRGIAASPSWSPTHWHHEPHPGLHSSRWISDWQPEIFGKVTGCPLISPKWKQTRSKDKPVDEYKSTDWVPEIIWNLMLKHTRISALAEYQARDMKLSPDRTPVYYYYIIIPCIYTPIIHTDHTLSGYFWTKLKHNDRTCRVVATKFIQIATFSKTI